MLDVVKETSAGVVIMHMLGEPRTMQNEPRYADVIADVRDFFCQRMAFCITSGVAATHVAFDPGIGFGKDTGHNVALLRRLDVLAAAGSPLLVGVSRKSFIGRALGLPAMEDRSWPTVALTSWCREHGARIFRVHDVKPNVEALRMTEAILGA
jgi:dihydropteroate synthase